MSQGQSHYPCKDYLVWYRGSLADSNHDCWVYHLPLLRDQGLRLHQGDCLSTSMTAYAALQVAVGRASWMERAIVHLCSFLLVNSLFPVNFQRNVQSEHKHVVVAQVSD